MLNKAKELTGYTLQSLDGEIGKVKEFYFDDQHWAVRYLVADTGTWLSGRQVLISPYALSAVNSDKKQITVQLTSGQIEGSPSLDADQPVSKQFEETYYKHYGWPLYWSGFFMWGPSPYIARKGDKPRAANPGGKPWNPSLRSTHEVSGYHIQASDGEVGHVDDFVIDDENWAIRYLVIDTRNWWPGKSVLISPRWIDRVDWDEAKVSVNLTPDSIKKSPEFTPLSLITRDYETSLHGHHNRKGYWIDESTDREQSNR